MHNAFANTSITVGSAIKTGKLLQPIMDKMNAWMQTGSAYAGQYIYCDVPDVECGELAFTQDDFWTAYLPAVHPTAAGHRYIADRILSVLPDTALPFEDVPEGAWYYMDVAACYYRSLMVGVADTRFAPDLPLDRAMVATIVHRIAGAPDAAGTNMPFRDVPAGAYYAQPVLWAYHAGVVNGCPIDQHLKCFSALGAEYEIDGGMVNLRADKLVGTQIFFDKNTVGATINAIMASVKADGLTIIENAAKEPHVVDLANCLNSMGADILGAGTDVIKIRGVKYLHGTTYSVIPDQIEAGTFMAIAAAARSNILIRNVIPKHLEPITQKLVKIGVQVEQFDDAVRVIGGPEYFGTSIKTNPHPGFPTDMQPQMAAVLTCAKGASMVTESIFDNRFRYVDELRRMGANISVEGRVAVIEGVERLKGAPVKATDLRAGAALIVAALGAEGVTEIYDIHHVERGYENMEVKLRSLGADIQKVDEPDPTAEEKLLRKAL